MVRLPRSSSGLNIAAMFCGEACFRTLDGSSGGAMIAPNTELPRSRKAKTQAHAHSLPLPEGWSRRFDRKHQRYYYLDHATRSTSWKHPLAVSSRR